MRLLLQMLRMQLKRSVKKQETIHEGQTRLLLDLVGSPEHAINAGKIVRAGKDGVDIASGGVVFLEVSTFAEIAHLPKVSIT